MENIVKRYRNGKFIYGKVVSINEDKTEVFQNVCTKCGGSGKLQHFHNVDNGMCYKCMGSGKGSLIKKLVVLTDEEIKEDIINRIVEKRHKNRQFVPDYIVLRWRNEESIEYLMKLLL